MSKKPTYYKIVNNKALLVQDGFKGLFANSIFFCTVGDEIATDTDGYVIFRLEDDKINVTPISKSIQGYF